MADHRRAGQGQRRHRPEHPRLPGAWPAPSAAGQGPDRLLRPGPRGTPGADQGPAGRGRQARHDQEAAGHHGWVHGAGRALHPHRAEAVRGRGAPGRADRRAGRALRHRRSRPAQARPEDGPAARARRGHVRGGQPAADERRRTTSPGWASRSSARSTSSNSSASTPTASRRSTSSCSSARSGSRSTRPGGPPTSGRGSTRRSSSSGGSPARRCSPCWSWPSSERLDVTFGRDIARNVKTSSAPQEGTPEG